jgi:hypothetical protein
MRLILLNLLRIGNKTLFLIGAMWCCGIFALLVLCVVITIVPAGCLLIRLTDWDSSIDKDIDRIKKRGSAI